MNEFIFQWPIALLALLGTFPLVWMLGVARRKRIQLIEAMGGGHPTHRKLRDVLRVLAYILLILALARPGYAPHTEATSRTGRDVVFAIDVSQSMLAEDAPPSRLEVAKQGVRDALHSFGNERVGLVVYAGSASILCPLTYDYDFVRYMLEQANPRTVDFGGTTLQAAVEKVVDQVFMDGRDGVQDLIVLTDGGDHGSTITQTVDLLNKKGIDTLLLGLGNPHQGAPIQLTDNEGKVTLLEYQGRPVYTKLDDAALREFAAQSQRVDYLPVATQAFNLGQIYLDYAKNKPTDASDSENGVTIYQEAAFFFMLPALLLLIIAEGWTRGALKSVGAVVICGLLLLQPQAKAAEEYELAYQAALHSLSSGAYEDAAASLADLYRSSSEQSTHSNRLAAVQFNRGLALIGLSTVQETSTAALSYAQLAQQAFLSAKRYDAKLERASIRLQMTASRLAELQVDIAEQKVLEQQTKEQMEILITQLQALLKAQTELRQQVNQTTPQTQAARAFLQRQQQLKDNASTIQSLMVRLDSQIQIPLEAMPDSQSLFSEPIQLILKTQDSQQSAARYLNNFERWPLSGELQLDAIHSIEKILELLTDEQQQAASDDEEYEDMEDDEEYTYESEESMISSESMSGDLAAGSEMQALPVPNYSAEDILMEEQGSQQFRQQKRASSNAGKVEKDF